MCLRRPQGGRAEQPGSGARAETGTRTEARTEKAPGRHRCPAPLRRTEAPTTVHLAAVTPGSRPLDLRPAPHRFPLHGEYGLLDRLPAAYYLSLLALTAGFVVALRRAGTAPWWPGLYCAGLLMALRACPPCCTTRSATPGRPSTTPSSTTCSPTANSGRTKACPAICRHTTSGPASSLSTADSSAPPASTARPSTSTGRPSSSAC
ncbi:hypothetical protein NKH18_20385 [Streptomyces sp. M10(2022)]